MHVHDFSVFHFARTLHKQQAREREKKLNYVKNKKKEKKTWK